ncbi:threonine synthase [Methylobacterium oryzihabitans]|uniref:Threonine synthase n=1 Tax=Methylobacterium oryzihabitans TaxID=2499852 RepID=A0A437PDF4_9HYPH|nr:threonine synthase [Methylobacterium oryzihabitans]RVU20290.1 threonine synthase [Methylobacterium oryzihabitans]
MLHVSTRGAAAPLSFTDALLAGLARDGGLYLPESWPTLPPETIAGLAGRPYADAARTVLSRLVDGEIPRPDLDRMIDDSYAAFRHPAVCPLVQLDDNLFLLELHHGPTLAFKDVAMQLLGRLMDHALRARGSRATIVGATSGDTGSAAVEAFRGLDQVDVFILYPHGRVSEVQRRQMTSVDAPNVHALAIEGTFDDCQAIVKALFQHPRFAEDVRLSGVNSINWARVAAQVVYYFTSAVALGAPHRPVSFSVPTGNFGDILAGWVAKRMGLPVGRLMIGTNANDILARTLESGAYEVRGVQPTTSPSMDIQISSNFERLLFEAMDRDAEAVVRLMAGLRQSGAFRLDPEVLGRVRAEFDAAAVPEPEVVAEIRRVHETTGQVLDPHSAIGVHAARRLLAADPATPVVALATAHAAKFPDAVEAATGLRPALPPHLADLMDRPERFSVVANDEAAVERFIRERARILRSAA